jgi:hypothetical protein
MLTGIFIILVIEEQDKFSIGESYEHAHTVWKVNQWEN